MRNAALYVLLRAGALVVPRLPTRVVYVLGTVAGTAAYIVARRPRGALIENLSVVLDLPPVAGRVRRCARYAFCNNAKNWLDTLRIRTISLTDLDAVLDVEGWEHLEAAASDGRGVILVAIHLGNFDFIGQALVSRGYQVTVPVERVRPERLFTFLMRERRSRGINLIPADGSLRALLGALRRSEVVAIAGDRNIRGTGAAVEFFGRPAVLPVGPASLARRTKAPLLVAFGVRAGRNRFRGYITPAIPMRRSSSPSQDDRINTARLAEVMQRHIACFPDQWMMFAPVWSGQRAADEVVTIEAPSEALA